MTDAAKVQALPTESVDSVDVLDSLEKHVSAGLFAQLTARVELGVKKYGTRLKTHNGRDVLLDAKQECLDGIMYSQQAFLQKLDNGSLRARFIRLVNVIEDLQGLREHTAPANHRPKEKESNAGEQPEL